MASARNADSKKAGRQLCNITLCMNIIYINTQVIKTNSNGKKPKTAVAS